MENTSNETLKLLSDTDHFRNHPAAKYHFCLSVVPADRTSQWEYDLNCWEIPPTSIKRTTLKLIQFSTNNLSYALMRLRRFSHDTGCYFVGHHYQFPANRVAKIRIDAEHSWHIDEVRKLNPQKPNGFYRLVKKVFDLKIDLPSLARISAVGYPEHEMYLRMSESSLLFNGQIIHLYQNKPLKTNSKNESNIRKAQ